MRWPFSARRRRASALLEGAQALDHVLRLALDADLAAVRGDLANREADAEIDVDVVEAHLDARDSLELHVDVLQAHGEEAGAHRADRHVETPPLALLRDARADDRAEREEPGDERARRRRRPAPRSQARGTRLAAAAPSRAPRMSLRRARRPAEPARCAASAGGHSSGWAGRGASGSPS